MVQGWVYVLVNSSMPGLAKVGRTTRTPLERAAELSAATGVATPFVVAFEQNFADCERAERDIHAQLDGRGYRLAQNREFFRGSANEIIRVILQAAAVAGDGEDIPPSPAAETLLARGDKHLFGEGEALQDLAEACACYRQAAARGSLIAVERLGAIYSQIKGKGRAGRRRALRQLKDGALRGNYYCYVEMASLFATEGHLGNGGKAWDFFFARRADGFRDDVEAGTDRYILALRRYMMFCLDNRVAPTHLAELQAESDAIVHSIVTSLDSLRDAPESRLRLAAVLRWSHEHLLPPPTAVVPTPRKASILAGILARTQRATV